MGGTKSSTFFFAQNFIVGICILSDLHGTMDMRKELRSSCISCPYGIPALVSATEAIANRCDGIPIRSRASAVF